MNEKNDVQEQYRFIGRDVVSSSIEANLKIQ